MSPFCGSTDTPILDFWWHLLWVLKPEWVLPYSSFAEAYVLHYTFPEIHLWCNICQPLGGQHGSQAVSSTYLQGIGGTQNQELSCRCSQCEIRQARRSINWATPARIASYSFWLASDSPLLDFWCRLSWISKPGVDLLLVYFVPYMQYITQVHLWCDTRWPLNSQHSSWAFLFHILAHVYTSIGRTRTRDRVCGTVCADVLPNELCRLICLNHLWMEQVLLHFSQNLEPIPFM